MDPITFFLIVGAALWVTDTASSGLVRAELGGGLSGAARGAGRNWVDRRKRTHKRRQKARSKTKAGRIVNYVQDEAKAYGVGVREGWPEGRRLWHEKRRQRWEAKPPWWRRLFGESEAPSDDLEQEPEDPKATPKGTPNGEPEGEPEGSSSTPNTPNGERDIWGDPEPIRTRGKGVERFRLDVHIDGASSPSSSGAWATRLPKADAVEAASYWARNSIMSQLTTEDRGVLYRTTTGADEQVGAFAGHNDPATGQPATGTDSDGQTPAGTDSTRGSSTVGDLNNAQAVIAAWEEIVKRIEQVQDEARAVRDAAASAADNAGIFKVGTEADGVGAVDNAVSWLGAARERVEAVLGSLHDDFDASIEASSGKAAEAHAAFQEG